MKINMRPWGPAEMLVEVPEAVGRVYNLLVSLGSLTNAEAMDKLGGGSLSRRITDLVEYGVPITKARRRNSKGRRYTRYFLDGHPNPQAWAEAA